jgi:hypothetical protein
MTDALDVGAVLRRKWQILLAGLVTACLALAIIEVMPKE